VGRNPSRPSCTPDTGAVAVLQRGHHPHRGQAVRVARAGPIYRCHILDSAHGADMVIGCCSFATSLRSRVTKRSSGGCSLSGESRSLVARYRSLGPPHLGSGPFVTQYPPGRSTDMRDGPRRLPLIALGALGALICADPHGHLGLPESGSGALWTSAVQDPAVRRPKRSLWTAPGISGVL